MKTLQEWVYAGPTYTPPRMIQHTVDEAIGLKDDLAQDRLEIVDLRNERDSLKVDALQTKRKVRINMSGSLLQSRTNEILEHANAAWDEHKELLNFSHEHLRWQCFISCSLSHMSKMIAVLEISLIRPLPSFLHVIVESFKVKFEITKQLVMSPSPQ